MTSQEVTAPPASRWGRWLRKIWWLHSFGALGFGVGVMLFARSGLKYAEHVLLALLASWGLMFVALRFIVGPANRSDQETLTRKGVRVATNYVIKQFYQQMFFFLVPLYGASSTWELTSPNWWLPPLLLVCAVLSTMDLVFDHFIMERRWLASAMYGLAMFAVLNVLAPLVLGTTHREGLWIAAVATPLAVALLSFSVRAVFSVRGLVLTALGTVALVAVVSEVPAAIAPAPLTLDEATVGHGPVGAHECLPASKRVIRRTQLHGLRCGTRLSEPGGLKEALVHQWWHGAALVATTQPQLLGCDDGLVVRSEFPQERLPADPAGAWRCVVMTRGGQLVGARSFVIAAFDWRDVLTPARLLDLVADVGAGELRLLGNK